jgi:hypothetical protein
MNIDSLLLFKVDSLNIKSSSFWLKIFNIEIVMAGLTRVGEISDADLTVLSRGWSISNISIRVLTEDNIILEERICCVKRSSKVLVSSLFRSAFWTCSFERSSFFSSFRICFETASKLNTESARDLITDEVFWCDFRAFLLDLTLILELELAGIKDWDWVVSVAAFWIVDW